MDRVLVLFSGGIDSTAALHRVFTEHKDLYPIVHHVHLESSENRSQAEALAVKRILKWYKAHGFRFSYVEMSFKTPYPLWDANIYGMTTGAICSMDKGITHFATGATYTTYSASGEQIYPGPTEAEFQNIVNVHAGRHVSILPVFRDKDGRFFDKQGAWDIIPNQVKPLIWSCRRPEYGGLGPTRCNRCETCRELNKLEPPAQQLLKYEL